MRIKDGFAFALWRCQPTVCVTCVWAGVDSIREQKKIEARKMLENAAESHTSGARFVRQLARLLERWLKKDDIAKMTKFLHITESLAIDIM